MTLEEQIILFARKQNMLISTAESLTGGLLMGQLVGVSGASEVIKEGYITYADEAKHEILNVSLQTLEKYTAVSKQTAKEMAEGLYKKTKAQLCLVTTGYAGPTGGTKEDPVGTVYIGCCLFGNTVVEREVFTGSRQQIRQAAVKSALKLALSRLLQQ